MIVPNIRSNKYNDLPNKVSPFLTAVDKVFITEGRFEVGSINNPIRHIFDTSNDAVAYAEKFQPGTMTILDRWTNSSWIV